MSGGEVTTRPADERDAEWVRELLTERWGEPRIVARGRVHDASRLPAIVAERSGQRVGLATYAIVDRECELMTLDAIVAGAGVGTALLAAVEIASRAADCSRDVLITSNDNLVALRFYQKRGYRIVAVHADAITRARQIKPCIPLVGNDGIPIRDEIELEKRVDAD